MDTFRTSRGRSLPLGATALAEGVNFALLCRHGTSVKLVLLADDRRRACSPRFRSIRASTAPAITGTSRSIGLPPAFRYGWRVDGPVGLRPSLRPQPHPARPGLHRPGRRQRLGRQSTDYFDPQTSMHGTMRRSLFFRRPFDWREDAPLLTPLEDSIIYELHVRGFTCHPSRRRLQARHLRRPGREDPLSAAARRHGRRAAAGPRIRRGRLPVRQSASPASGCGTSGATTASPSPPPRPPTPPPGRSTTRSTNSARWSGPSTRPASKSSSTSSSTTPAKATTAAAPIPSAAWTTSFTTCSAPSGDYLNFSGCGNTVNCNHPVVRDLIITCLRFWVGRHARRRPALRSRLGLGPRSARATC